MGRLLLRRLLLFSLFSFFAMFLIIYFHICFLFLTFSSILAFVEGTCSLYRAFIGSYTFFAIVEIFLPLGFFLLLRWKLNFARTLALRKRSENSQWTNSTFKGKSHQLDPISMQEIPPSQESLRTPQLKNNLPLPIASLQTQTNPSESMHRFRSRSHAIYSDLPGISMTNQNFSSKRDLSIASSPPSRSLSLGSLSSRKSSAKPNTLLFDDAVRRYAVRHQEDAIAHGIFFRYGGVLLVYKPEFCYWEVFQAVKRVVCEEFGILLLFCQFPFSFSLLVLCFFVRFFFFLK